MVSTRCSLAFVGLVLASSSGCRSADAPAGSATADAAALEPEVDGAPGGGTEDSDAACSDGVSNDGDGFVDCDDFDCSRNPDVSVCGGSAGETDCDDGVSNDGDGFVDCEDFDCEDDAACRMDGISGLVTQPNVEGTCYSVAIFSPGVTYEGATFAADHPYPVVATRIGGAYVLQVLQAATIDAVPVTAATVGDGLVKVLASDDVFDDPDLPPSQGTSTDLCWWDGAAWRCPIDFLQGTRGDFATDDAFVPQAWIGCKPYVYLPLRVEHGGGSFGLSILAPVR